ncbi:hypothetical protein KKC44_04985 [Patescibacteria group bacterium]|nr:hypothetical protein [Patescibacteria group bacterium]MBU2259929.1 hypothetical protein [Patescibacteria group bacterium]
MTSNLTDERGTRFAPDSIVKAKGSDVASAPEDYSAKTKCEGLKKRCISELNTLMSSSALYTATDLELEKRGLHKYTEEENVDELKYSLERIPRIKERLDNAKSDCISQITAAQAAGYITSQTARHWLSKLSSSKYHWSEKEDFIHNKLPRLIHNWAVLTRDIKSVESAAKGNRMFADLPEVQKVLSKNNSMKKYNDWRNAVSEALGAIEADKRLQQDLFKKAKTILEGAVHAKALSLKKVGSWLHRIFKSNAPNDKIADFINGSGAASLSGLIDRWSSVRSRYDKIENKRKVGNDPRGFHFVTTEKFLDWHYTKRLAYVEEAEKRFVDVAKEKPILLAIRRELDSQDWESAAVLIRRAESEALSESDSSKLSSMKRYLREHQSENPVEEKTGEPQTKEESETELQQLLSQLPPVLQPLYRKSINAGKFFCLAALMYNRVWCREKGHVLDGHKETILRESSEDDTKRVLEHGDDRMLRNAAVSSYHEPSIRGYSCTGINAPQVLHVGYGGQDALVAKMASEDNERFRYWTTLIPEGVDYGTHSYIVKKLNRQIKRCLRNIDSSSTPAIRNKPLAKGHATPTFALAP